MQATRLDMVLKLLTFTTVFLGVLSVLLTGCLPPPQPLIITGILIVGFFFWKSRLHNRVYLAIWHVITFLFLGWCFHDLIFTPLAEDEMIGRIPIAAMQLSVFLQIFKVYNAKGDRDYVHMFLLSFFQFVSCAGVSVEFYLLPLLLVYLVVAVWALTLFHFRRQLARPEALVAAPAVALTGRLRSGRLLTAGFFTGTFLFSLLIAVVAAMLFTFFPRSATSDNPLNLQGLLDGLARRFTSGSSDSIDLDIAGIFNRNPALVMRIQLPSVESPPPNLLWRRGALHHYDGRTHRWNRPFGRHSSQRNGSPDTQKSLVNILRQKSPGLFVASSDSQGYNSIEDLRKDPQLLEQSYTVLGFMSTPVFSAYSPPVAVLANFPWISCDVNESFYSERPRRNRGDFTFTAFSRNPLHSALDAPDSSSTGNDERLYDAVKGFYTQLPPELSPRFETLARQITQGAVSDYQKARAIRNYLSMHCRYSLDLRRKPGSKGPLYDFLFRNRAGHCEYFASALVILLRESGIPSRLAYGYSTGDWDPDSRTFEVRQLDAHAWAEVFIKGRGWMPFDATPVVPEDEEPQTFFSALLQPVTGFLKRCETQWGEFVIGYTRFKQRTLVRSVTRTARTISDGVTEYAHSVMFAFSQLWKRLSEDFFLRLFVPVATVSVILALAVGGIVRIRRQGKFGHIYRRFQPPRRSGRRVRFYDKMLRLLMDKGIAKEVADTPLEFADRIVSTSRPFSGVKTLTELYYFVRFGNGKLTPQQSRTVRSILQRLTRLVPPRKPVHSSEA